MKRCFIVMKILNQITALLFLVIAFSMSGKETANEVVDLAVSKIRSAPSVSAKFTISSSSNSTTGEITVSGKRFYLTSPVGSTWYDGQTLWSYSADTKEVNISEPTTEEVAEINPFAFITTLQQNYSKRLLKSAAGTKCVEFVLNKGKMLNITKAVVTFSSSTMFPSKINLILDGKPLTVTVNSIKSGKTLPDSSFRFNRNLFPGVELIDLR